MTGGKAALSSEPPELSRWCTGYWDAFFALTRSRPITMGGPGPIPLTEIESYLRLAGIYDADDQVVYLRIISAMDDEYLTHWETKHGKSR